MRLISEMRFRMRDTTESHSPQAFNVSSIQRKASITLWRIQLARCSPLWPTFLFLNCRRASLTFNGLKIKHLLLLFILSQRFKKDNDALAPAKLPLFKRTCVLQPGVSERVTPVLVRQVRARVMRAHGAVVGRVSQRAAVGRRAGGEGAVVLRRSDGVQAVDRVMVVGQAGRGLLVPGVPGVAVAAELQEGRFGGIGRYQGVR